MANPLAPDVPILELPHPTPTSSIPRPESLGALDVLPPAQRDAILGTMRSAPYFRMFNVEMQELRRDMRSLVKRTKLITSHFEQMVLQSEELLARFPGSEEYFTSMALAQTGAAQESGVAEEEAQPSSSKRKGKMVDRTG